MQTFLAVVAATKGQKRLDGEGRQLKESDLPAALVPCLLSKIRCKEIQSFDIQTLNDPVVNSEGEEVVAL